MKNLPTRYFFAATIAALLPLAAQVNGQMIGVQFQGAGSALAATDSAGAVPQTNFNVFTGSTFTNAALHDNSGLPTTATLSGSANGTYFSGSGFPAGGDRTFFSGQLYNSLTISNGAIAPTNNALTVSAIPFASYDVYVYGGSDANGRVTTFALTPTGGTTLTLSLQTTSGASSYVQSMDTYDGTASTPPSNVPVANYVEFTGLTASSFSLAFGAPGNGSENGFQIVGVIPEPSTWAMFGASAVVVAWRLRARRRDSRRAA